jgi:tetratricopeptide (TPR) repeat protein
VVDFACLFQRFDPAIPLAAGDLAYVDWQSEIGFTDVKQQLATERYEQALRIATELGRPTNQANSLLGLAEVARAQGNYDEANEHYEQALALVVPIGDRGNEAHSLVGLGHVAVAQGADARARPDVQRVATIFRQLRQRDSEREAMRVLKQLDERAPGP